MSYLPSNIFSSILGLVTKLIPLGGGTFNNVDSAVVAFIVEVDKLLPTYAGCVNVDFIVKSLSGEPVSGSLNWYKKSNILLALIFIFLYFAITVIG